MFTRNTAALMVLLTVLLANCTTPPPDPQPTLAPTAAAEVQAAPLPTVAPSRAVVTGRAQAEANGQPLGGFLVRLAKVLGEPGSEQYVIDGATSPTVVADERGVFVFPLVEPGKYVLVVGRDEFASTAARENADTVRVFDFPADQVTDVGDVKFPVDL